MALAPVVAASLNVGLPTRPYGLWVDGLDVIKNTGGNTYGVDIDSVDLTERGPGQVSNLTFTIDDPQGQLTVADTAWITLMDFTHDLPLFTGWLASYEIRGNGVGRTIQCSCVGAEIVLDWMYVPTAITTDVNLDGNAAVAMIVNAAIPVGVPLRVAEPVAINSNLAGPTGTIGSPLIAVTVGPGTLRQCLSDYIRTILAVLPPPPYVYNDYLLTVDFRFNLRGSVVTAATNTWTVDDYVGMTLQVVAAGRAPINTNHRSDSVGATRQVYVTGGNAAGTGVVGSGSGKPGPVAPLTDAASTTAAYLAQLGYVYLNAHGGTVAGTTVSETGNNAGAVGAEVRAGQNITLTDPTIPLTAYVARMNQIDKTFNSNGDETWTIHYGGPVTGSQYIRRLTRAVLTQ